MASVDHPIPSETIWETALDLTHRVYYFISTSQHNLLWANLNQFNLNASAPTLKLDLVNQPDLSGDVTSLFLPCNTATNFNKEALSKGFLA
jgi:penicillin V acylase-like amidase (Ntn superfamily)